MDLRCLHLSNATPRFLRVLARRCHGAFLKEDRDVQVESCAISVDPVHLDASIAAARLVLCSYLATLGTQRLGNRHTKQTDNSHGNCKGDTMVVALFLEKPIFPLCLFP